MQKWFAILVVAVAWVFAASAAHAQPSLKMMIPANPGGGWDQTGRISPPRCRARSWFHRCNSTTRAAPEAPSASRSSSTPPRATERRDDRRHGDGRRHHPENSPVIFQVTPLARLTEEYGDRGAGQFAAQNDGGHCQSVQSQSRRRFLGRRFGRRHRSHPGRLDRQGAGVEPAKINYVPFKGGGEAVAAIIGGHVTAGVSGIGDSPSTSRRQDARSRFPAHQA